MKIYVGGLATETNTFLSLPTVYNDFVQESLIRGSKDTGGAEGWLSFAREIVDQRGWQVVDGLFAMAFPAGKTTREAYETLRDEILAQIRDAAPLDIIFLNLHGAMVADGYDDCEGDLLQRAREIAGQDAVIGALLDPHCHLTEKMLAYADVMVIYKEWPHTDMVERSRELFDLLVRTAEGEIRPMMSVFDPRMISTFPTNKEPMRSFVDKIMSMEGQDGVLSISIAHGFPYGDQPEMGARMLVVTDDRKEHGDRLAQSLGREFYTLRHELDIDYLSVDEALEQAAAFPGSPVVLADTGDTIAGGTPGDATFLLRAMLEKGVQSAAINNIWDPMAVSIAVKAGIGARLDLRVGGKTGVVSGDPLDLSVDVLDVLPGLRFHAGFYEYDLGDVAVVRADGIDIVLAEKRMGIFNHECFSHAGIDPLSRHILVVKSTNNFYAGFADIAAEVLHVSTPGGNTHDVSTLPYKLADRSQWPLEADPLGIS